jgi:hypothetical protein
MKVVMMVNGVPLAPFFGPYEEVIQRACPICGKKTLTMDTTRATDDRLLCCSCGAWGSSSYADFYSGASTDPAERAWFSLQRYTKRVADELAAD